MTLRALIVEDDGAMGQAILDATRVGGLDAGRLCETGEEALELLKNGPYEAVVLDTTLPGMSGFEVIKCIRNKIGNPHDVKQIPILILSEDASIESKVRALELGANDYMTKPFHRDELVARLKAFHRSRINWRVEALTEMRPALGRRVG